MRFLLVAHAQTDWNVQGRYQGHRDVPLNERGRGQALVLQKHLARDTLQAIVASDLSRARETADILARPHGLAVRTDRRLRELHFGAWEGLTYAELQERHASDLAAWHGDPLQASPPNGERLTDLERRLKDFLDSFDESHRPESTILVVAHRGSLRALLCLLLGQPVARNWEFHLDVASVSAVETAAGKAVITRMNETFDS